MLGDQTEIRRITRYLDIQATPKQADIAFVFGSASNIPAQIAAMVYQEGIVDHIVLTGAINRESGKPEAEKHLRVLLAQGILLKRFLPPNIRYFTVTYELPHIRRDNWWLNDVGRHYVLKEWNCIARYLEQGDLALIQPENGAFV